MKKLLTILFGAFMVVAAYGQYPEVEELDDGATFGEQRTKINDDIRLDNMQSDTLVVHYNRLEGIGDSLAVHNLLIWNNADAIEGQKDNLTDLTADVDANTADIGTNTANIATNTGNISDNTTDISTNNAAIGVNTGDISTNAGNISTNVGNINTNAVNISSLSVAVTEVDNKYEGVQGFKVDSLMSYDNQDTLYAEYNGEKIKILLAGITAPVPPVTTESNPISHNQDYISHPSVANGDVIGQFHYLCTDSVFNDRSTGSYGWSIISGNTGTAYDIGPSTGLITVANAASVVANGDYSLGIRMSHNGVAIEDFTATILYRSSNLLYVDANATGANNGSFGNDAYQDFTAIDALGNLTGGETVLIKRGTTQDFPDMAISNSGARIFIGAYGTGAKPIFQALSDGQVGFTLGAYSDIGVDDADSITIMDIEFIGGDTYIELLSVVSNKFCSDNHFYRLDQSKVADNSSGSGMWLRGDASVVSGYKIWDCGFTDYNDAYHDRALKIEGTGNVEVENIWVTNTDNTAVNVGDNTQAFGYVKYAYFDCNNPNKWTGSMQLRNQYTLTEWIVSKDYYFGVDFNNDGSPGVHYGNSTARNWIIEGSTYGVQFANAAAETYDIDNITLENLFIKDPIATGMNLFVASVSGANVSADPMPLDNIVVKNCLVTGAGAIGIRIESAYMGTLNIENTIVVESVNPDIYASTTVSLGTFRNIIYDTFSGVTLSTSYDTSDGNPFVGGNDYRTSNSSFTTIIDSGAPIGQTLDIIGNTIVTQDIGAFEFGGTAWNWTDR